jgi:hypothetical protein
MEMKLKGNEFWLLKDTNQNGISRVFDDLNDAVKSLRELMEGDVDVTSISLVSVDIEGDDWKIKQVPWSEIAVRLVKEK